MSSAYRNTKIMRTSYLGTSGIHNQTHQQQYYQLKGTFDVYLHAKNQYDSSLLS